MPDFRIYVMGDAGEDVYSWAEEGSRFVRPAVEDIRGDQALDAAIPSGARFTADVLLGLSAPNGPIPEGAVKLLNWLKAEKPAKSGKYLLARPLDRILAHLKETTGGESYRIQRYMSLQRTNEHQSIKDVDARLQAEGRTNCIELADPEGTNNILIFHHGSGAWDGEGLPDEYKQNMDRIGEWIGKFNQPASQRLRILVNVKQLPAVDWVDGRPKFKSAFWRGLYEVRNCIGIVVSLSALCRAGAAISHGLSWEKTVEEFASELQHFGQLRVLNLFRDLFVRVDSIGLLHLYARERPNAVRRADLYFEAFGKKRPSRDPDVDGRIVGKNSLILAALAAHVCQTSQLDAVPKAIKVGLQAGIAAYQEGYNKDVFLKEPQPLRCWAAAVKEVIAAGGLPEFVAHAIPPAMLTKPPGAGKPVNARGGSRNAARDDRRWRVLKTGNVPENELYEGEADRPFKIPLVNVALAVVDSGPYSVFNTKIEKSKDHLWSLLRRGVPNEAGTSLDGDVAIINAPIASFEKLPVVDRNEIEDLSGIKDLVGRYIKDRAHNEKPVSIAVFGPPGTGKSFAVKQIAETIDHDGKLIEIMEYNLAQFHGAEDLGNALNNVGSTNNGGKTPLVFFDEFDSSCGNDGPLGWLKFFLAPMQDGNFYGAAGTINIGRAIFVFAGGNNRDFAQFVAEAAKEDNKTKKVPDFISRLRGYVDMKSLDADVAPNLAPRIPLIRRAMMLRGLLEKHKFVRNMDGHECAMIDEAVVYALLTVDKYEHGVRSLEAILQMCAPIDGRIRIGSLPARSQLQMHVDPEQFYEKFRLGRERQTIRGSAR